MQPQSLFFRILYGSVYFLLYLLLIALLLVTPGDAIQRSIRNAQTYNIWIVTVAYVATVVIVCFVYVLRLYVSKTILASIPKPWVPIEKGDIKDVVYKMITTGLNRSAAVAYRARPRVQMDVIEDEPEQQPSRPGMARLGLKITKAITEDFGVALPSQPAGWGEIEHHGWASPNSPDLPDLQYSTVISELPNLVEAKALTLAPPDPTSDADPPLLDPSAASLLQRLSNMSLRDYMDHLVELGVLQSSLTTAEFVSQYEYARYSNRFISNARFRELMHLFAEVLRTMQPLNFDALSVYSEAADEWAPPESDAGNDASSEAHVSTNGSRLSRSITASTEGSVRRPMRNSSINAWSQYGTAPNTPGSRKTGLVSRKSSHNSFAQSRRPMATSQPSSSSLRSKASAGSGSVIRLATRDDPSDLPYVLSLKDTAATS